MPTIANITVNSVENKPYIKVIHVTGEVDESNLPQLEEVVNPLTEDANNQTLIFDFSGLEFISSKVIGCLAALYTTLSRDQRKMIFAQYNDNIKDILTLVGLDQLIVSYPTLDDALQNS